MPNRRVFLTTVASATVGMFVMRSAFAQGRREMRRCRPIEV